MPAINANQKSFTQADGAVEVFTPSFHEPVSQVSFSTDSTAGTLAVRVKYHPKADFETLYESDGTTPVVITLASHKTFQLFDKWVYSFEFTPTDVDASYTPLIAVGRMYDSLK